VTSTNGESAGRDATGIPAASDVLLRPLVTGRSFLYIAIAALSIVLGGPFTGWTTVAVVGGALANLLVLSRLPRDAILFTMVAIDLAFGAVAWFGSIEHPFVSAVFVFVAIVTSTMAMTARSIRIVNGAVGLFGVTTIIDFASGEHPLTNIGAPADPSTVQIAGLAATIAAGYVGIVVVSAAFRKALSVAVTASHEATDKFYGLFERSPVGALFVVEDEILLANSAAYTVTGVPDGELIGSSFTDLLTGESCRRVKDMLDQIVAGDVSTTVHSEVLTRPDGSVVWVDCTVSAIAMDGRQGVQILMSDETARLEAEQATLDSERRFRTAFTRSATPALLIDASDGIIADLNSAYAEMLGLSSDAVRGMSWDSMIDAGTRSELLPFALRGIEDPTASLRSEVDIEAADGSFVRTLINVGVIANEDGRAEYFIAQFHDVTELRAAQAARLQIEGEYRNLFDRHPVALYRTTASGVIKNINQAAIELLGVAESSDWQDEAAVAFYVSAADRARFSAIMSEQGVVRGFESQLRRPDGEMVWVRDSARLVEEDGRKYYEGALVDITEQRAAEDELRLRAKQQAAVAELGQLALGDVDTTELFLSAVGALGTLFEDCLVGIVEWHDDELRVMATRSESPETWPAGTIPDDVQRVADKAVSILAPLVETDLVVNEQGELGSAAVVPIIGDVGTLGVLAVVAPNERVFGSEDVRLMQAVAAVLALAQERWVSRQEQLRLIASKDEFIASVSHELRTPLTVVAGMASELEDRWESFSPEESRELVSLMSGQAADMRNLIEDLLVVARADIGKVAVTRRRVDMCEQIKHVLVGFSPDKRERIIAQGSGIVVMADEGRVRQILRNLLTNAIRYGGDEIVVSASVEGADAIIRIADDGVGIPEVEWDAIFEPYARAHSIPSQPNSVGLGLTVSRTLARLMGGDLTYRFDGSSVFECRLPAAVDADS
jgi:PAS domain S-box-containing protein